MLIEFAAKSYSTEDMTHAHSMSDSVRNITDCESLTDCAVWCTEDPSCTAANYDDDTSQCELLTSPIVWLTPQHGSIALIGQATGEEV